MGSSFRDGYYIHLSIGTFASELTEEEQLALALKACMVTDLEETMARLASLPFVSAPVILHIP